MMKRLFCLTLVAVMLLSVFAFSFSAAEVNDKAATGSDVIKFDNSITKWAGPVQFYIYDPEGEELIPWGSKRLNGTDEGNNIWSKDLSEYGLESGKQYCIIFCDATSGSQTYDLVYDSSCLGDTAEVTTHMTENPVDSNKTAYEAVWKNSSLGPRLQVTSIGNVVGQTCLDSESPYDLLVNFLENTFENARVYSGKDDQTLIDDTAGALGLSKNDVEAALDEAGAYTNWDYDKSNLPGEGSSGGSSGSGSGSSGSSSGSSGSSVRYDTKWIPSVGTVCPADELDIIKPVTESYFNDKDIFFFPTKVIATREADGGTYYAFLCSLDYTAEKLERDTKGMSLSESLDYRLNAAWWEVFTVFVDSSGNSKLMGTVKLDVNDVKTAKEQPKGWTIVPGESAEVYDVDVKAQLERIKDMDISVIAELGFKNGGKSSRFLCYGTKGSETGLYVIDVTTGGINASSAIGIANFDLPSYVAVKFESEATADSAKKSGGNDSLTSPATGHTYVVTIVLMLALVAFLGVGISVKHISKKHD